MTTDQKALLPACHRSACKAAGADWWNPSTREYYCLDCAIKINEGAGYQLCISPVSMPRSDQCQHHATQPLAGLVEKLESLRYTHDANGLYAQEVAASNAAIDRAIEVIRTHQPVLSEEREPVVHQLVEREPIHHPLQSHPERP